MGMAASQARYLALVARKSNCEYEGQQINQARTALSNQSANLFNQMLGLEVPIPPSTQDFTKTQYSYTDGFNASTIDSWQQLATPEEDYNYVVTSHYYTDVYTGSEKKLSDPQVQFAENPTNMASISEARGKIIEEETDYNEAMANLQTAKEEYEEAQKAYSSIESYVEDTVFTDLPSIDEDTNTITITNGTDSATYKLYDSLTDKSNANTTYEALRKAGALGPDYDTDKSDLYFDSDGNFVLRSEIQALIDKGSTSGSYRLYKDDNVSTNLIDLGTKATALATAEYAVNTAKTDLETAIYNYTEMNHPSYVGNCKLEPLASLTKDQEAEIRQIVADMEKQGITSNITKYYNPENGSYTGGIYSFKMNGITYYTTFDDLNNSFSSGNGINNIDGQQKLPYYNATYVSTKIEKTEKALLETDGNGRFSSIRFESDSITYALNSETITDDVAYQDAMNQYNYESAKYDKMIQDINAKTSIIQREDQQLELRLKQLDTEHNALSTEIDAVQKVVNDNVEKSFKTFGG